VTLAPILLVEDSPEDVELTLNALGDYHLKNEITVARDGAEALDFLFCRGVHEGRGGQNPLVVLLDIKLPRIDGLEVLRQIRAHADTRHIPVVMMTSSREGPDIERAYALGANAYVVKPMSFAEFTDAVRSVGMFWILTNEQPPR
jgi:CheY-like chemotaxis protein